MWLLLPLAREFRLCRRVAIGILQAFDVATKYRLDPNSSHKPIKVHNNARLITVGTGENNSGFVRLVFKNWPDCAIEFRVHHTHLLAVRNGLEHHMRTDLDCPGYFNARVDHAGTAQQHRFFRDSIAACRNGFIKLSNHSTTSTSG